MEVPRRFWKYEREEPTENEWIGFDLQKEVCRHVKYLGPCQTSGLAAAVAKRPGRYGTAFERGYIDSYVKR